MSESDGEQAARSVALEQAYVHDVYEQCAEKTAQSRHWPRIYKFLEELEPGALVCDIGCGNGKYLTVNDNVFKVGGDRCKRLTDIAREKENEVLICDNLSLPFRDESFDAVLSIAVVHHFATTERRVNALKELARVLRIGGRLVISVWAMEQRHRKFESQDVLVPWPKAYCLNRDSSSGYSGSKSSAIPCINELDPDRFAQKSLSTSKRAESRKCKRRSYWIDPIFSPSPSTSSLSSPNETCYSFFRRALQKLAGGKRDSENRAWFLETWQNGGCKNRRNMEIDDIGDVDDIPIELRRLEDDTVTMTKLPDAHSIKSKSLGDILEIQRLDLVRSRSSIPGFSSSLTSEFCLDEESKAPSLHGFDGTPGRTCREASSSVDSTTRITDYRILGPASMSFSSSSTPPSPSPPPPPPPPPPLSPPPTQLGAVTFPIISSVQQPLSRSFSSNKPRLVKQKTHIPDEASLESPADKYKHTAIQEFFNGIGDIEIGTRTKRGNVHKQSSMNEELMSMERLMERDRVRRNIMKQASLNEEIICKPSRTFGNFRETLYSGNATKRFQLIKSGLTNRIKQSTTSMEKVSSMALKNGFVKILQGWTSGESNVDAAAAPASSAVDPDGDESKKCKEISSKRKTSVQASTVISGTISGSVTSGGKAEGETIERRLSKEDGSDSSKDSSLQSDTSVDSEDSFASVIFVPKQQQPQQQRHHNYLDNSQQFHYEHQFPSLIDVTTVPVGGYQLRTTSAPPSPRIKHPPEIHGPRLKLISISPLLKQFPATSKSLPPPSPPRLSPRNFNIFGPPSNIDCPVDLSDSVNIVKSAEQASSNGMNNNENIGEENKSLTDVTIELLSRGNDDSDKTETSRTESLVVEELTEQESKNISTTIEIVDEPKCKISINDTVTTIQPVHKPEATSSIKSTVPSVEFRWGNSTETCDNLSEKSSSESIGDEDSRGSRLKQIKELLKQKPGFATRCGKSSFPLVRRASTATSSGRAETIDARTLPRLLSLELFNPETDDLDSDSSGLSSPESIGSVISVISDERFTLKNKDKSGETAGTTGSSTTSNCLQVARVKGVSKPVDVDDNASSSSIDSQANTWRKDVINDIGQLCNNGKISQIRVDTAGKETTEDSTMIKSTHTRLSEKSIIDNYGGRSTSLCLPEEENKIDQSSRINNCKYNQLMDDTIAWLRGATGSDNDNHYSEYTDNNNSCFMANEKESIEKKSSLKNSISDETMDFMIVSKNGECINGTDVGVEIDGVDANTSETAVGTATSNIDLLYNNLDNKTVSRQNGNYSSESMEMEGSISLSSDATTSQTSSLKTSRFCGGSTTCLVSGNLEYKSLRERRRYLYQKRSASEEIPGSESSRPEIRQYNNNGGCSDGNETIINGRRSSFKSGNINGSSSQESLLSDYGADGFGDSSSGGGGGAITYHQYYHVFREGELDQLINKYVENLHIISSYYDHASWCIVAEKVQVWTI